jgi:hypothetical protein
MRWLERKINLKRELRESKIKLVLKVIVIYLMKISRMKIKSEIKQLKI